LIAIVVMVPAIWTFVSVLNESNFERDAQNFLDNELASLDLPHIPYIKNNAEKDYNDGESYILLNTFGLDEISESKIAKLEERLKNYKALRNTTLKINQNKLKNLD
ncbi:MAG: hypothetical protein KDC51_04040, partial [Flavobacteriaceae bacterium]|nr:hypothetical protein [Flavobacteriaceae bacterium]